MKENVRYFACIFACLTMLCVGTAQTVGMAVESDGGYAVLALDSSSRIASLREKDSGRELVAKPMPFFRAIFAGGVAAESSSLRRVAEGRYEARFPDRDGGVEFTVEPYFGGWTFRVVKVALKNVTSLQAGRVAPACCKYAGSLANLLSDDASGVCVRGYSTTASHMCSGTQLAVAFSGSSEGQSFGLAAGPRAGLQDMLRAMTLEAGVPRSASGGAWSLGAEENRSSYLISDAVKHDNVEEWFRFLRRTGIGTFHIRGWWDVLGWYSVSTNRFPRELADLRDVSMKAHAAGFRTSMHTLTDCIARNSPWIPTPAASNLIICHTYTLARPIPASGKVDEIYVNEKPASDHGFNFATWSRGNTIRIGTEMFQYKDISFEPPYRFTGVTRRAFGTPAEAHSAGDRADYLWCFFGNFLGEPGTPLTDELAERIARVYHAGGFDQIYFDGADGLSRWPSKVNGLLRQIYTALAAKGHSPHYEDSLWTTAAWWFHSRIGAWDYTRWSPKTFIDRHVRLVVPKARQCNLLEPNLGWWPIVTGCSLNFGYTRDEVEYFGAKSAGHDASFSMVLPGVRMEKALTIEQVRQATQLGWYERFRVARAFAPDVVERMAAQGRDFRLRQGDDGRWTIAETEVRPHRMGSPLDKEWTVDFGKAARGALRVRLLDVAEKGEGVRSCAVLGAADVGKLAVSHAKGVEAKVSATDGEHGKAIVFTAKNGSAKRNASWASAKKTYPRPFLNLVKEVGGSYRPFAVGAWVKGDGSGATLNLQMRSPTSVNSAISEHYVKLDFKGWRHFTFSIWREHDAGAAEGFVWPYMPASGANYYIYERALSLGSVENAALWLNGIELGTEARVEVADFRVMPIGKSSVARPSVVLNGVSHPLPFGLSTGEFAELEDGRWTLFALDGTPLRMVKADGPVPALTAGKNSVAFMCDDASARAEVTVTGFVDEPSPALKATWTEETRRQLAYEAAWPEMWAPSRGMSDLPPLRVRPGEKAKVAVEIVGPVARPVMTIGGERREFPVTLAAGDTLRMDDGVRWRVVDLAKHAVREEGRFAAQLPAFSGSVPVTMGSSSPNEAAAQLRLVKLYLHE